MRQRILVLLAAAVLVAGAVTASERGKSAIADATAAGCRGTSSAATAGRAVPGSFRLRARLLRGRRGQHGLELVVADRANGARRRVLEFPDARCRSRFTSAAKRQMTVATSAFVGACGTLSRSFSLLRGTATITGAKGSSPAPVLGFRSPSCGGAPEATLVAAGDIAACYSGGDDATARLVDRIRGTVATLGDNAYSNGSREDYAKCYGPTWGRAKPRTRPAAGNHDYHTPGAAGYFDYFGATAGPRGKGYYSYDLARWHVVVLNSNCSAIGGCGAGSPQERWLRADLAAHRASCTLAYWHHPRFSSGKKHGGYAEMGAFWQALYEHDADLVLTGHEHNYERFAPQTPAARADDRRGIRQFVVGTGGEGSHYPEGRPVQNSEVRNADTFGVLVPKLRPTEYEWRFVPEAGKTFTDRGSTACH